MNYKMIDLFTDDENSSEEFQVKFDDVVVEYGDIFELGNHRLMCGDSTKKSDVDKLLNGTNVRMMFADPPYGYQYQSNSRKDKFDVLINDDKILDFFTPVETFIDGFVFVCASWKNIEVWVEQFKNHYELSNMIIWDKGGGGIGDLKKTFSTDYEIILCSHNNNEITGKRIGSVWKIQKDGSIAYSHPTQKPIELPMLAIENTTNKGDIIYDPFGGSGTTMLSSEYLGRTCYMMEMDTQYCATIISRYETTFHKKHKKIKNKDVE